jgi:hypothetical protein
MEQVKSIDVLTRKPHTCFACLREYPSGTEMRYEVWADNGIVASYYCSTCVKILSHVYEYGDEINEGCVKDMCNVGETPEEYLKSL